MRDALDGRAARPARAVARSVRDGVDHVVIGGLAVLAHGHRRTTRDVDTIPEPSAANLHRLAAALRELEARPVGRPAAAAPDAEQFAAAPIVPPLDTRHGELHVLRDVPGAPPYAELRVRALVIELDGLEVAVCGLDDLIAMKRASGRRLDL